MAQQRDLQDEPSAATGGKTSASRRDGGNRQGNLFACTETVAGSGVAEDSAGRNAFGAACRQAPHRARKTLRSADVTAGHRERLRTRFDRGEELQDYELLELVLFRAIPRRDTKPIAKAMMDRFGSFAAAVGAPAHQLLEIDGVGERVVSDLRLVRAAAERFAHGAMVARETLSSTEAVAQYYRALLRTADREEFHILFLDKKNKFLASERVGIGTVDHTPVYPREVVARALAHGASAVVLVHNHPSGDPTPSRADIALTQKIVDALKPVAISVHDHIVIAGDTHLSMRGEGYF